MQGLVTVFGGSGFVGRQTVRSLAKRGLRVRVACRRPNLADRMRLLGDVGQIEIMQANIRMPASVDRALEGAEACVNMVRAYFDGESASAPIAETCTSRVIPRLAAASAMARAPWSCRLWKRWRPVS